MQPQQPQPPQYPAPGQVPPPTQNYDFIMNPDKPTRKKLFGGGNGGGSSSLAFRLLVVLGGLFIIAIVVAVLLRAFGANGSLDKTTMLSVAQDQTQILHLTTSGVTNSVAQPTKDFAITTQLSLSSEQSILNTYLKSHGLTLSTKALALKQSATIDASLTSAQASSTFDVTFKAALKDALTTYHNDLKIAYPKADTQGKKVLNADYNAAELLLAQLSSSDS